MEKFKLMHSLNTMDSIVKNNNYDLYMHICYFYLSCLYAKINGFYIELHTDELGKELLSHAPYDNIIVDIKKPEGMPKQFFAWPKFIALENSDNNIIHIDGDVMLRSMYIKDLLWSSTDVICQCEENKLINDQYGRFYNVAVDSLKNCDYPDWANRECNIMYNTGVIGIFNNELKKEWIDTYWKMIEEFKTKEDNELFIPHSYPDIIIEQQFLRDLIISKNYKCNFIINEVADFSKMNDEAVEKGYFHVMNDKRKMLHRCIDRIMEINPLFKEELLRIKYILNID